MSSLDAFEGIDFDDGKPLEEQEREDDSEEEVDKDGDDEDDDLTPPARPHEIVYEKAVLQLPKPPDAGGSQEIRQEQDQKTRSTSTPSASSPLPMASRHHGSSIDSSGQSPVSRSPQLRFPVSATSNSPTLSPSAGRIVNTRPRTFSGPSIRPGSWASGSPTQGQFSAASPTSSYAAQPALDYPEPPGSGQSPSNKSDFATYMQQSHGLRRLSLDRRHSYSANRLASPSPGEFTASPSSPPLPNSIPINDEGSPTMRPVDADEAWVDLSSPHSRSQALAATKNSYSLHARTVSDPFPGSHFPQAVQQRQGAVQHHDAGQFSSSDRSPTPDASLYQTPSISTSPSTKSQSKTAVAREAQSPYRSNSPFRDTSSSPHSSDNAVPPVASSSRLSASPRAAAVSRPSLLRQHSSPTKSISSSRPSRSLERNLTLESSPRQHSASGHHKRSPSLGGYAESIRSLSPSEAKRGTLGSLTGASIGPSGRPDIPFAQLQSDSQAAKLTLLESASSRSPQESTIEPIPLQPSPPIGLALGSLQSFRFGGSSASPQEPHARTPSPPFLPSALLVDNGTPSASQEEVVQHLPDLLHRLCDNQDLSVPPPSGYESSDDVELDVSPFDEHSDDTDMFGPFPGAPTSYSSLADLPSPAEGVYPELGDGHRALPVMDEAPPSPLMSSIPLPLFDASERSPLQNSAKSPDWGVALDYNKRESSNESWQRDQDSQLHPHPDVESAMDEEALTPLERIFLFAKSEVVEHRETVSRALPRWIGSVEICEAVDYILPLFEGLALDEDPVKEAFAASLDSLIYHFLVNCPLQELDASHQIARLDGSPAGADSLEARLDEATEAGIATSLVVTQQGLELVEMPELASQNSESGRQQELLQARQGWPDDSKTVTPGTGSTMRSSESGTAVDILSGDLTKEQTDTLPRPHISFTQFHEILGLLLLNDSSIISSLAQEAIARLMLRINGQSIPSDDLDIQAADAAEQLDDLQPEATSTRTHEHKPYVFSEEAQMIVKRDILANVLGAISNIDASSPPQLAKLLAGRSSTGSSQVQTPAPDVKDTDAAAQISSFFSTTSSPHPSQHGSDFTLDARQGRFVALSCLNLLIDSGAISAELQAEYLLPIAMSGVRDSDPMIRMAAVDALAGLAKMAAQTELANEILPALEISSRDDNSQVRRAVCGSFQEVVQAVQDRALLRRVTVNMATALYHDEVAQVRQGILEVLGPLIHLFVGDVPEELVRIFEGLDASDGAKTQDETLAPELPQAFQPLVPAFAISEPAETERKICGSDWDVSKDHERAIITAYNLPGVLLSLGPDGWPRLRSLHGRLATDAVTSQARYLIASSIHDVAKLVGPQHATTDLLPLLPKLAGDEDLEVSVRLFERLGPLVDSLSPEGLPTYIRLLCDWWDNTTRRNWHRREMLAEAIAQMATRLEGNQGLYPAFTYLLKQSLRDDVACVRKWGMQSLSVAMAYSDPDLLAQLRDIWDDLAADSHHKYRSLAANAVAAVSPTVALEQPFLLDLLVNLANDPIPDVRIGVARALRFLCATGGPYDLERPPRLQAALVLLATADTTASVRELLNDVRLDPLPDDFGLDDIGEDTSFSSSDEEDASDRTPRNDLSTKSSGSRAIPVAQTTEPQDDMSSSVSSPPVDTWNLADLASPHLKLYTSSDTSDTRIDGYTSLESLFPQQTRCLSGSPDAPKRVSGRSTEPPPLSRCSSSLASRLFLPSSPSSSPLPYDTQKTPDQSWHLSMRDVDQFVAIDLAV